MNAAEPPAVQLARRLRSLRTEGFAGHGLTQGELAKALGTSVPLISSWESTTKTKIPPRERLAAYAAFFATERSVAKSPFRVLPLAQLTDKERVRRDELLRELTSLRSTARRGDESHPTVVDPFARSHLRFPRDQDITIVCSALPPGYLKTTPYTNPEAPDYVDLYRFADLDALLELFGHLRAANPHTNNIRLRAPDELKPDDFTSHLVLLGGVDWNSITAELLHRLDVPVRQLTRESEDVPGGFQVSGGELFAPVLRKVGDHEVLVEDVAHFFRAPSPLNEKRTVTICTGSYARGTLGAVRALTDARFRDRNEDYLHTRFADQHTFSIVSRVKVVLGTTVITPDWSSSEDLLHEWPVPPSDQPD